MGGIGSGGARPGSGPKKLSADLKRQQVYCRLPGWLVDRLNKQEGPISRLIEKALMKTFHIRKEETETRTKKS